MLRWRKIKKQKQKELEEQIKQQKQKELEQQKKEDEIKKKKIFTCNSLPSPPLIGLQNIGSTCYMNATLQCFSHTEVLTNYFLNENNYSRIYNNNIAKYEPMSLQLSPSYLDLINNYIHFQTMLDNNINNNIKETKNQKKLLVKTKTEYEMRNKSTGVKRPELSQKVEIKEIFLIDRINIVYENNLKNFVNIDDKNFNIFEFENKQQEQQEQQQ